ncbi:ROK family protein [Streptomyces sp. NPDC101221]|uniref:ROK family transcriptional regulator n=1 Tax=Streptomyces sp. NPDC101221 TaxID=3366132 RepID=UPI0038070A4A
MKHGDDDSATTSTPTASSRAGGRQGNVRRVLESLRLHGPSSQAALARRTELSRATVNNIVKSLREEGIAETRPVNGREFLVALVSRQGAVMSVQVNVTSLRASLFDFGTHARHDASVTFQEDTEEEGGDPELVVDMVHTLVSRAGLLSTDLAGVAVAVQAPLARATGTVTSWARLQLPAWRDIPVAESLQETLGVPVWAENDANLAALAEWTWGSGQGAADFLYAMCSAKVGGGLVIDGRIYRGGDGLAGEIGHMVLEPEGPVCFCGSRGCLTTFVSERSLLHALKSSGGGHTTLHQVIDSARRGDPACRRVLYEAGRHLGRAFANTAKLMAPSVVAVGGTLSKAGPLLFDSLVSSAEVQSLKVASPDIRFVPASLGDDAALLGGVAMVFAETGTGASALPAWALRQQTVQKPNSR